MKRIAQIYELVDGKDFFEITDDPRLKDSTRQIFLFEYPSDGLLIKGYISFVPECEQKPLLVVLRGGQ